MSAVEQTIKANEKAKPKSSPVLNRTLDFLSSVRFGVVLLCILVILSILGMVIIQQNVQGFDAFYATRTPAEKIIYGYLGLFDVYHSWYYNLLLLILSLNIVLASIDRFPSAWSYLAKPKLTATRGWLLNQKVHETIELRGESEEEVAGRIQRVFEANGLKTRTAVSETSAYATDDEGRKNFDATVKRKNLFVFGESGRINRLGAYIVHVFLLTLFLGHFVALQTGFDADVRLTPDTNPQVLRDFNLWQQTDEIELIQINLDKQERYSVKLPFTITCTEIEQKLIDPNGEIDISNTLDWRTQIRINDPEYGETVADVSLNKPFSYRLPLFPGERDHARQRQRDDARSQAGAGRRATADAQIET
jgi:cytochrome c biogenesis protein